MPTWVTTVGVFFPVLKAMGKVLTTYTCCSLRQVWHVHHQVDDSSGGTHRPKQFFINSLDRKRDLIMHVYNVTDINSIAALQHGLSRWDVNARAMMIRKRFDIPARACAR
jgi:hypothetical protein